MPLVDVVHARLDADLLQKLHSAHAEEDLLLDPDPRVVRVKAGGDFAVLHRIALHVGVEQVERYPPHLDFPDIGEKGPSRKLEGDLDVVAPVVPNDLNRHVRKIVFRIIRDLPAILVDALVKIAALVKQAHSHHRDFQVARRLQEIAREDAQPAGIDREALVNPEFGRKVDHRSGPLDRVEFGFTVPVPHVLVELVEDLPVQAFVALVLRGFLQAFRLHGLQHLHRVVPRFLP